MNPRITVSSFQHSILSPKQKWLFQVHDWHLHLFSRENINDKISIGIYIYIYIYIKHATDYLGQCLYVISCLTPNVKIVTSDLHEMWFTFGQTNVTCVFCCDTQMLFSETPGISFSREWPHKGESFVCIEQKYWDKPEAFQETLM